MGNIVEFKQRAHREKSEQSDHFQIAFPSKQDVLALKKRADAYAPNELVGMYDFDGECWRGFFDHAKTAAERYELDEWDVFAALLHNLIYCRKPARS